MTRLNLKGGVPMRPDDRNNRALAMVYVSPGISDPEARRRVLQLISDLVDAEEARLKERTWTEEELIREIEGRTT